MAQLAERDAKILEVKEKAKQFVRDKLKSAQEASAATIDVHKTAAEQHKSTAEQHAATIADLATKLASAEAAAEAAPAALGSAIPGELDADSAALISQLRADIRKRAQFFRHALVREPPVRLDRKFERAALGQRIRVGPQL